MEIQSLFNLKSRFVSREVGSELILVPLSDNVARMNELFTLNETAKFIWESITENTTVEELEKLMTEAFHVDNQTARRDIDVFLNQLELMFKKL